MCLKWWGKEDLMMVDFSNNGYILICVVKSLLINYDKDKI